MSWLAVFVIGHVFMAFLFYANHRFIFHGWVPAWLRGWKRVHTHHHWREFQPNDGKYDGIPWWGWLGFAVALAPVAWASMPFGLGMFSYVGLYELTHYASHKKWGFINWRHHMSHHWTLANHNYSTFWVFIDRWGGTYADSSSARNPLEKRRRPRYEK